MKEAVKELATTRRLGFTLIELLTAMAVLSVIVVTVANLFSHSAAAWDSGTRRSKSMLVGRALTDYFVRETTMALCDPAMGSVPGPGGFDVLKGTDPIESKTFSMADLFGNTAVLSASGPNPDFPDGGNYPRYGTVEIVVRTVDKGRSEDRAHTGRAFLWNRNRYRYD